MADRDTYRYHMKQGKRIVHRGITNDPERREREHQQEHPGSKMRMIGPRISRDSALQWEREGGKDKRR